MYIDAPYNENSFLVIILIIGRFLEHTYRYTYLVVMKIPLW